MVVVEKTLLSQDNGFGREFIMATDVLIWTFEWNSHPQQTDISSYASIIIGNEMFCVLSFIVDVLISSFRMFSLQVQFERG